jgi:hypothetical protein
LKWGWWIADYGLKLVGLRVVGFALETFSAKEAKAGFVLLRKSPRLFFKRLRGD